MSISGRKRHDLFLAAQETWGEEAAETLMEVVPPMNWADVATKQDLALLEERLMRKIAEESRRQMARYLAANSLILAVLLGLAEGLGRLG